MIVMRLGALCRNQFNSQKFTQKLIKRNISSTYKKLSKEEDKNDLDKPIEFSKTEAATWLARHSRCPEENKPPYQTYVISGTLLIFITYFFFIREESDLDTMLDRPLTDIIPNIDKAVSKYPKRG